VYAHITNFAKRNSLLYVIDCGHCDRLLNGCAREYRRLTPVMYDMVVLLTQDLARKAYKLLEGHRGY
jgi:hypothetical protein